jgi:hypothetical protein
MKWQDAVRNILECDGGNLIAMAKAAKVPSRYLFQGANFNGVDLRGQDLSSLDLTGADFTGALLDSSTIFSQQFDPRLDDDFTRRTIRLPRNLYICVRIFEAEAGYVYTGWAIKHLIERSYFNLHQIGLTQRWSDWYSQSLSAQNLVSQQGGHPFSLKLKRDRYEYLSNIFRHVGGSSKGIRLAILVGVFSYWNVPPERIGSNSILEFMQKINKRPKTDAALLSLARGWQE